jgi:hypothetical protein
MSKSVANNSKAHMNLVIELLNEIGPLMIP